jgi:hypothetical protein
LKITGIINNVLRPQKTLKKARIKSYNTLAIPAFLHDNENWTMKANNVSMTDYGRHVDKNFLKRV